MAGWHSGSLRKRADGRWEVKVQIGGKRSSRYFPTKTSAEEYRKRLVRDSVNGILTKPTDTKLLEFLDQWITQAQLRPKTERDYREFVQRHIAPALGGLKLSEIRPTHIVYLDTKLLNAGRKATAEKVHQILSRALKTAVLWGLIAKSPADGVKCPTADRHRKDGWDLEQVQAFLQAADSNRSHWCLLWKFLLSSGLRVGEALALEWDDLHGNQVRVNKSVSRHRMDAVTVGAPKTRSGIRTVTLPNSTAAMLHGMPRTSQRLFSSERGTVPNLSILRRHLRHLCNKANVPYLGIHGLRHVHASVIVASGVDIKTLQVRLGHSRPSTTMNIYPYLMPGRDELAAQMLDELLRKHNRDGG